MKTKSKKSLKNQADKLWSKIIRSKQFCEVCGKQGHNSHHIIGRINHITRWDIRNGCYLCYGCHFKAHNDPIEFIDWLKANREDDYYYLTERRKEYVILTRDYYEGVIRELKEILEDDDLQEVKKL